MDSVGLEPGLLASKADIINHIRNTVPNYGISQPDEHEQHPPIIAEKPDVSKLVNFPVKKCKVKFKGQWWPPLLWFFENLQWSPRYSHSNKSRAPQCYHTSWEELAIVCDLLTKGGIGDTEHDTSQPMTSRKRCN